MFVLNLKSYRRLNTEDKEKIKQKAFQEIRTFAKPPPRRDLTSHLCTVLNLSFSMSQMFIILYEQNTPITLRKNSRLGVDGYLDLPKEKQSHIKQSLFNFYYDKYKVCKMDEIRVLASERFNLTNHLVRGIAPRKQDLTVGSERLPCGDII